MQLSFDTEWAQPDIIRPGGCTRGPSDWSLDEAGLWSRYSRRFRIEDHNYHSPCWIYQGHISLAGYGKITGILEYGSYRRSGRLRRNGATIFWHTAMYRLWKGEIDSGFEVAHLCHIKRCGNPEHLMALDRYTHRRMDSAYRQSLMNGNDGSIRDLAMQNCGAQGNLHTRS